MSFPSPSLQMEFSVKARGWVVEAVMPNGDCYHHFKVFKTGQDGHGLLGRIIEACKAGKLDLTNKHWNNMGHVYGGTDGCLNPQCDLLDGHEGSCEHF